MPVKVVILIRNTSAVSSRRFSTQKQSGFIFVVSCSILKVLCLAGATHFSASDESEWDLKDGLCLILLELEHKNKKLEESG